MIAFSIRQLVTAAGSSKLPVRPRVTPGSRVTPGYVPGLSSPGYPVPGLSPRSSRCCLRGHNQAPFGPPQAENTLGKSL
jgi:hypothetical protein